MEKMSTKTNALNWFEIPMSDVDRAKKFYETILEVKMVHMEMMGMDMLMFPSQSPFVGGALVKSDQHVPSSSGSVIYLNAHPDLQFVLDRLTKIGAEITLPKTLIDEESGYMAFFKDSEGNLVGLHSMK